MPADEEMMATQLSSSPVQSKKTRTTLIQAADNELEKRSIIFNGAPQPKAEVAADRVIHDKESLESYFTCEPAKAESITLCKANRVGTHNSNSVKIILSGVEEKQFLLNRR